LAGRVNGGAGIKKGSRTPGRDPWRDGRGECACGGGESASRAHVSRGRGGVYGVQRVRMRGAGDRLAGPRGYGRCYKHDWGVMGHRERDLCGGVHSANEAANDNKNSGLSTGKREGKVGGGKAGGKWGNQRDRRGIYIYMSAGNTTWRTGWVRIWNGLHWVQWSRRGREGRGREKEKRGEGRMTKIVGVRNIYRVLAACAYNANIGRRISAPTATVLSRGQRGRGLRERGHWEGDRLCIRAHGSEGWSLDTGGGL